MYLKLDLSIPASGPVHYQNTDSVTHVLSMKKCYSIGPGSTPFGLGTRPSHPVCKRALSSLKWRACLVMSPGKIEDRQFAVFEMAAMPFPCNGLLLRCDNLP